MLYRPDIDGLRAVAVLAVVGFHAFPRWFRGGFVGVDIFFVISGFLITGIILREVETGHFSFARFYARRVRRIFPALVVVLLLSVALGWFLFTPEELISLGKNISGGAAFVSNIVLYRQAGYFDISADQKPLLHLWSLGIEEQYYILWPLILFFGYKKGLNLVSLVAVLLLVSFGLNIARVENHAASTFYLLHTRAWELLCGCCLAWITAHRKIPDLERAAIRIEGLLKTLLFARPDHTAEALFLNARALIGSGLIIASVVWLRTGSVFPGWWALLPTIGAALIISAEGSWFNRTILANRVMVFVGIISYPLYLWHWPLLSFATIYDGGNPPFKWRAAIVVASIILAWLTYALIEKPLRFGKRRRLSTAFLCVLMTMVGCIGIAMDLSHGFEFRIPAAVRNVSRAMVDVRKEWRVGTCLLEADDSPANFSDVCVDKGQRPLVFLWGDSIAGSLYPGLRSTQAANNFGIAQFTIAGCPPVTDYASPVRPHCKEDNDFAVSLIAKYRPDIIILDSAWDYSAVGLDLNGLADTISKLRKIGNFRIVILGPPVNWGSPGLPQSVLAYYWENHRHELIPTRSRYHMGGANPAEDFLRRKSIDWGVDYISVNGVMCDDTGCLTRVGNSSADITAFDSIHLTLAGSKFLAETIIQRVLGAPQGPAKSP